MSVKSILCRGVAAAAISSVMASAAAAAVAPVSLEAMLGTVVSPGPFSGRDDVNAATAAGGDFYSMGQGGLVVADFGSLLTGTISVFETTFFCPVIGAVCGGHEETLEILVSDSYAGGFDLTGFTSLGSIGNADAQTGAEVFASGFRYVALIDTTTPGGASFDGFDLDAVLVTPVPLPSIALLLISGMGGLAYVARRKAV